MRRVAVFFLGGTISMVGGQPGSTSGGDSAVVPRLGPDDLLSAIPGLDTLGISVAAEDFRRIPSANIAFADIAELVRMAAASAASGAADGYVVVQGTDTIEETSFLIDLLWSSPAPIVVTGAMRNPTLAGADGPANLLAAIAVAASDAFRDQGALVVLDDEVHAARYVGKLHTTSTGAFGSPNNGPIGRIDEGYVRSYASVRRMPTWPVPAREVRVPLLVTVLDDDGVLIDALEPGAIDGLVVAGFGGGHVRARHAERLGELASAVPVVLASRAWSGSVLTRTYGAVGLEIDLIGRGLIPAGLLDPLKARLLLCVLIAAGASREGISAAFAAYG